MNPDDKERLCPICEAVMQQQTRQGITIDYCDEHGVWLDSGELEGFLGKKQKAFNDRLRQEKHSARTKGIWEGSFLGVLSLIFKSGRKPAQRKRRSRLGHEIPIKLNNEVPDGERLCPVCQEPMIIELKGGLKLDVCAEHGKWFDSGELRTILERFRKRLQLKKNRALSKARTDGRVTGAVIGFWGLLLDE